MAMRIKHLSRKMRLGGIVYPLLWVAIITFPLWVPMIFIIQDVGEFFKFFNSGDLGFTLLLIFLFFVSPIIAFGFSAKAFIERKNEYKRLSICNIHLKEVYLFEDTVRFEFFRPEHNFACTYQDIEKVELTVSTSRHRSKNGYYYTIDDYFYVFTVLNGKQFTIEKPSPAVRKMEDIYRFIDLIKDKVGKFEYDAIGNGRPGDVEEKIKCYLNQGYARNYAKNELDDIKGSSIAFFIIGVVVAFIFKDIIVLAMRDIKVLGAILCAVPMAFFLGSIITDLKIHKDKIRDSKSDKSEYKIWGLKPWQLIAIKVLLILEIFHIIFK